MKSIFKTALALFALFLVGCDKEDNDKMDYYLSQPRDADLIGWWFRSDESGLCYWNFQQSGKLLEVSSVSAENLKLYKQDNLYWFTENKNVLNVFEKHGGWLYGSIEMKSYYRGESSSTTRRLSQKSN